MIGEVTEYLRMFPPSPTMKSKNEEIICDMKFIENVNREKKNRSMTTAELAELCGIPLSTLNKLLSGAIDEPKLSAAVAISRALGLPLGELCGLEDDSLAEEERQLVSAYRTLDGHNRELIRMIAFKESAGQAPTAAPTRARILAPIASDKTAAKRRTKPIPLYNLPVSAGEGFFLDDTAAENIDVPLSAIDTGADFALRVSGDSMEPKFLDGDMLLIKSQNSVLPGELGIFVCDGAGYFKKFTGTALHSLNPKYEDMPIGSFTNFMCCGKVVGRLKMTRGN